MTSSKESPKVQTRTTAPTMARDHATAALVKLMQAQQTALNNAKAGSAAGGNRPKSQPTVAGTKTATKKTS